MIELRDVRLRYDGAPHPTLDAVDLRVDDGELVVLAGPTGSGKSSLLGVLAGLVPAYTGGELSGDVLIDGVSVIHRPARERAGRVGYVGQDPASWFVTDTVEEELAFGMEQLGLAPDTMRRRVEETLDLLGIAALRQRDLRSLSGGEQQRVAIGSVLTMHPRLLVLDEPTSALDPTAAEDVLATLTRLVHDLGLSVVVAEHRLERVLPFADRVVLVGGDPAAPGKLVAGEPAQVLAQAPTAPPIVELGRLAGWEPLPLAVRDARRRAATLREHLGPPPAVSATPREGEPLVEVRGLEVVRGRRAVLHDVDLTLAPGAITALMGRNGAGKSTLLWTLQGRQDVHRGRVRVAGWDPAKRSARERRSAVGLVPQRPTDLLYLETVAEECVAADAAAHAERGACHAILERLAPGIDAHLHPRDLSEGQRLALAVAIVLTARPPVLLLDEPTRGLDYPGKRALAAILRSLVRGADGPDEAVARTVLVATHDVEFVAEVADDLLVLADGEIVSAGPVRRAVGDSPAFAPQVTKVLGPGWLRVDEVAEALAAGGAR